MTAPFRPTKSTVVIDPIPVALETMYHVPVGQWYAIGNSIVGLETALGDGYRWIDMDCHITSDGVWVFGHDTSPSDDHFIVSGALKTKYGKSKPNIEDMTWADVSTLRTPSVIWRGTSYTFRYYTAAEIMAWLSTHPTMNVALEMKQSTPFNLSATFGAMYDLAVSYGVNPDTRLAVMSIPRPAYNHAARFAAAHGFFRTIVLPHSLPVPAGWAAVAPYVDYFRGAWAGLAYVSSKESPMSILRSIDDTYGSQNKPSKIYSKTPSLGLRAGGTGNMYAFLRVAGVPAGSGVVVGSFILDLVNNAAWSGSVTITAQRVTSKWTASTLKYSKMPSVTSTGQATFTISGAAANSHWLLDITTIAQAWAAGAGNYGVRLSANGTTLKYLHSSQASGAKSKYKPAGIVEWSGPPDAPVGMNPDSGYQVSIARPTITWVYSDDAGAPMSGYQLRLNTTDTWTSPIYDAGIVDSILPQHVMTGDIALATPYFGRVRQRNAAGIWSPWSQTFTFGRTPKGTLTITNPGVAPNDFVTEKTPPIIWDFDGVQTKYRVLYTPPVTGAVSTVLADSGTQSGDDTSYTSPKALTFPGGSERVVVRVYDDVDRATTPGDPAYVTMSRIFTYKPGVTTPVTALAVTIPTPKPFAVLTWTRSTAPDFYTILRDGEPVAVDVEAGDVLVSGTSYSWTDTTATQGTHTWTVVAVVNGIDAASSPSVTGTTKSYFMWLLDPDDPTWWLAIDGKDEGSWAMGEQSEMFEVRGSDRLVIVSEALRGYEGSISGGLHSQLPGLDGLTAQQLRGRVWALKRDPTHMWRLVLSDVNIPVVVRNVNVQPTPDAELSYKVSFDFYQQGQLPWTD